MTALNRFACSDCDPITEGLGHLEQRPRRGRIGAGAQRGQLAAPPRSGALARRRHRRSAISATCRRPQEAGEAFGASPTGSIIVGTHFSNSGKDAWCWQGSGLIALPHLIGGSVIAAEALAVSSDATTIVGYSTQAHGDAARRHGGGVGPQAVRWSGASFGTIQIAGTVPGRT